LILGMKYCKLAILSAAAALLVGCGAASGMKDPDHGPPIPRAPWAQQINHVVIIVQENRSFDNLFNGYPGADTVSIGKTKNGQTIPLQVYPLEGTGDLDHGHKGFQIDYDGGLMDGWDGEGWAHNLMPPNAPYSYVPQTETVPLWTMAQQYVLSDRMFESVTGPSYPNHQYLIAGQSAFAIGNPTSPEPWGCDSLPGTTVDVLDKSGNEVTGPFPCFDYPTLADNLLARGKLFRYYTGHMTGGWNGYDAISHIRYNPTLWAKPYFRFPSATILKDIPANIRFAEVTWVVPANANSDHSGSGFNTGPAWVASVVNAIGNSKYWNTTVIFVVWDDWGGWYDHVSPPQLDNMGLGFRVPLLVISPYAKTGYISHNQHEFGSILKFTEETFGLPSLGNTDARADDLVDCFDFTQTPRAFVPIPGAMSPARALSIDLNDHSPLDY
jgi:phospholipase C